MTVDETQDASLSGASRDTAKPGTLKPDTHDTVLGFFVGKCGFIREDPDLGLCNFTKLIGDDTIVAQFDDGEIVLYDEEDFNGYLIVFASRDEARTAAEKTLSNAETDRAMIETAAKDFIASQARAGQNAQSDARPLVRRILTSPSAWIVASTGALWYCYGHFFAKCW